MLTQVSKITMNSTTPPSKKVGMEMCKAKQAKPRAHTNPSKHRPRIQAQCILETEFLLKIHKSCHAPY